MLANGSLENLRQKYQGWRKVITFCFFILFFSETGKSETISWSAAELTEEERKSLIQIPDQPLGKGFHIEPWMFNILGWLKIPKEKRPTLDQYQPLLDFIANLKKIRANYVNLWPPRNIESPRGKGTYEADVLWPSQYDRWSMEENILQELAGVFKKNGIIFFTMDRCVYPKELEEFPLTPTRNQPAPYISRYSREFLEGFVREQAASEVDGVGCGYDEQCWTALRYPKSADRVTREAFEKRYQVPFPEEPGDTESFRKWIVFAYEEFADYIAGAAREAKKANPRIKTFTQLTVLDTAWNTRQDWGVADDIIGHTALVDYYHASAYEDNTNLNHWKTAANVKRAKAANFPREVITTHNCPWASDPMKHPGYYLECTPVYIYGPVLSAVMHGASIVSFWRYNCIFHGGYNRYVEKAFSILDTLATWGIREAKIPKQILVLRSRASEDWWQVRQRYHPQGNPADQTRGFVYEKWL
ncbi:MAG: hypothetical protein NC823_02915, partial [Candidatus Omnitrophica bacterium]|nr:hypothetical protein [Candidatus Omnitrophota bacterium]